MRMLMYNIGNADYFLPLPCMLHLPCKFLLKFAARSLTSPYIWGDFSSTNRQSNVASISKVRLFNLNPPLLWQALPNVADLRKIVVVLNFPFKSFQDFRKDLWIISLYSQAIIRLFCYLMILWYNIVIDWFR